MAIAPINYTQNVVSPLDRALGAYQAGQQSRFAEQTAEQQAAQSAQREQMNAQNMQLAQAQEARAAEQFPLQMQQQRQQMDIQAQQAQRQAEAQDFALSQQRQEAMRRDEMRQSMLEVAQNPYATAEDYGNLMMQYPEISQDLQRGWETKSAEAQKNTLTSMAQIYSAIDTGNVDIAESMLDQRIEAYKNAGDEESAKQAEILKETLKADPRAAKASLGISIKALGGDSYDGVLSMGGANVQSSEMIGGIASVATMKDGSTRITDTRTGEIMQGDQAQALLDEAQAREASQREYNAAASETGKLQTQAELAGQAAGAKKAGELAVEKSIEAFDKIPIVQDNINTYDRMIELVQQEGARTGRFTEMLPRITASARELQSLRGQLGLNVVGSVTFGALSEGELKLAMETAMPSGMNEKETVDWLQRKKEAQQKVLDRLQEAATFLGNGERTVADWVNYGKSGLTLQEWEAKNGGGQAQPASQAPAQGKVQWSQDELSFMQAMKAKGERGEAFSEEEKSRLTAMAARAKEAGNGN